MPQQTITAKSADSQLLDKPVIPDKPDYSAEEIEYLGRLQTQLERARNMRDTAHEEFDGMTFIESWQAEEKAASTFIAPKLNREDTNFQSGIVRDTLFDLIAKITNMDLTPDIHAWDSNQLEITSLGQAIETIMFKVNALDNDDEKKLFRAYELFKHGYVFIEELWEERWQWAKKWIKKFEGSIKSAKWSKRLKMLYARPVRNILSGLNVYLGDITQYDSSLQPFIFTVKYRSYEDAQSEYGKKDEDGNDIWERWKNVTKSVQIVANTLGSQIIYNTWRLTEVTSNQVEEIHYQDKWNNEYAILLNGVLMTPIGMPLPWGYDDYNIIQQNGEPIHPFFAYGKSLVSRMKGNAAIYDEMLKMAVLKTQKSFSPSWLNMSGKVISKRVFMPGKITAGLKPGDLVPLHQKEVEGVTQSELAMIQRVEQNIKAKNLQPSLPPGMRPTQSAMLMLQQQAYLAISLFVFVCSLLEQKLTWVRLFNLLNNWFNPIDTKLDEARQKLINQYRIVAQETNIEGKGKGIRMVVPYNKETTPVTPQSIYENEQQLQKKFNRPYQIIAIEPDELKEAKYTWEITVAQREKRTSDTAKVLFRGMLADLGQLAQVLPINWQQIGEEFALVWGKDPSKIFQQGQQQQGQLQQGQLQQRQPPQQQGAQLGAKPPGQIAGMPQPEKGLAQTISAGMQ